MISFNVRYAEYLATFPEDEGEGENFTKYATRNTLAGVFKIAAHGKTVRSTDIHSPVCFLFLDILMFCLSILFL